MFRVHVKRVVYTIPGPFVHSFGNENVRKCLIGLFLYEKRKIPCVHCVLTVKTKGFSFDCNAEPERHMFKGRETFRKLFYGHYDLFLKIQLKILILMNKLQK